MENSIQKEEVVVTSNIQRQELRKQIWKIAFDACGLGNGWDFKQYVLGALFYRYISENFAEYMAAGEDINYADLPDDAITADIKDDAIKTKGYFIYPSQLFSNIAKNAETNEHLVEDVRAALFAIENSSVGYASEANLKGIFTDFDITSKRIGETDKDKNARLSVIFKGIEGLDFGKFGDHQIDVFGDAYEFLISSYANIARKAGGEFFTPQSVSKLVAQLAMHGQKTINKIYDPTAGSGSLLLQVKKLCDLKDIDCQFYGQDINRTNYNLARMNMLLHNVEYTKFNMALGNTLTEPHFWDDAPFDVIVSNPPFSTKWAGRDNPALIMDKRFAPAGVLAPKTKADLAFVLHSLHYLSDCGRAVIVCFPGVLYREGTEQKIREYLVKKNLIETIILLPEKLFFGTGIAVNVLVLSKHKKDTKIQFINANKLYDKGRTNNTINDEHIAKILDVFASKDEKPNFARNVEQDLIIKNNYHLAVSYYVRNLEPEEGINIKKINKKLKATVTRIDQLRKEIDTIIQEMEK